MNTAAPCQRTRPTTLYAACPHAAALLTLCMAGAFGQVPERTSMGAAQGYDGSHTAGPKVRVKAASGRTAGWFETGGAGECSTLPDGSGTASVTIPAASSTREVLWGRPSPPAAPLASCAARLSASASQQLAEEALRDPRTIRTGRILRVGWWIVFIGLSTRCVRVILAARASPASGCALQQHAAPWV